MRFFVTTVEKILAFGSEEAWKAAKWSDAPFSVDNKLAKEIDNSLIALPILTKHADALHADALAPEHVFDSDFAKSVYSVGLDKLPKPSRWCQSLSEAVVFYEQLVMRLTLSSAKKRYSIIDSVFQGYFIEMNNSGLVVSHHKISIGDFSFWSSVELAYFSGDARARVSLKPIDDAVILFDTLKQDTSRPLCQLNTDDTGIFCYLRPLDSAQKVLDYLGRLAEPVGRDIVALKNMCQGIATARSQGSDTLIDARLKPEYNARLAECVKKIEHVQQSSST